MTKTSPAAQGTVAALKDLLDHVDSETCTHEDTHRGGAIWTICDACGRKWADDEGGFVPYVDPPAVARARIICEASTSPEALPVSGVSLADPLVWRLTNAADLLARLGYPDTGEGLREIADLAKPASEPAGGGVREALAHCANEWADMATSGIQWLRNIRDGISTPDEALASMDACLTHCRKAADEVQAALSSPASSSPAEKRPANCRNRLRDEGKPYPKSGCASCGNGGMMGCPHERKAPSPAPAQAGTPPEALPASGVEAVRLMRERDEARRAFAAVTATSDAAENKLAKIRAALWDGDFDRLLGEWADDFEAVARDAPRGPKRMVLATRAEECRLARQTLAALTSAPAPEDIALQLRGANAVIAAIEQAIPDWRSYRDIVDAVECKMAERRS